MEDRAVDAQTSDKLQYCSNVRSHSESDAPTTHIPSSMGFQKGIRSGEICVRLRGEALCAADGAARGLGNGIRTLVMEPPTLQQLISPWKSKMDSLRTRRLALQERKRLVRDRYLATRNALDTTQATTATQMTRAMLDESATASAFASSQYIAVYHTLEQLFAHYAMHTVLYHYTILEQERSWITAWRERESVACQRQMRITTRRHHLTYVHLESETSGQIRLWRLPENDAQRTRCVKAATQNIKRGFSSSSSVSSESLAIVEVTDVYKIENKPLLTAFERHVDHQAFQGAGAGESKVKGLFCSVPTDSVERCVVWGMHGDQHALNQCRETSDDQPVFNRPSACSGHATSDAPGTERRFVALQQVADARVLPFPRRFSRYSTLNELRDKVASDLALPESPVRYLALCRVAMGKIQRVAATKDRETETETPSFPASPAVGSLFDAEDEEYVVRYPQAVVPEFLVEYRFARGAPAADRVDPDHVVLDQLPSHCSRETLPSSLFQAAAQQLVSGSTVDSGNMRQPRSVPLVSASVHSLPPVFGPAQHLKSMRRRKSTIHPLSTTETVLEIYGQQRRQYVDDLQQLRRVLWIHVKAAWDQFDLSVREASTHPTIFHQDREKRIQIRDGGAANTDTTPPAKRQSFKAKKLHGELALMRQLQEQDAAKKYNLLDRLTKKTKANGQSTKARPFR